jgi:glycosyltransferase involved in cell wall biosynthesis
MKVAFVTPWYGEDIPGGAESECRKTALNLKKAGVDVEILTTCVKDFHNDWSRNYHEEKDYEIEGLTVRRFLVKKRNAVAFDTVNLKLMNCDRSLLSSEPNVVRSPVSPEEEKIFIQEMINSPNLYGYIGKHDDRYDLFIFIPYMFGTTYYGSAICPNKSIIIPCLHDESYAYMTVYREMFRESCAIVFHAESEQRLAKKLYDITDERSFLIGEGVDSDFSFEGARFRKKYGIEGPFILYAGRKDSTKNVPLLTEYFSQYIAKNPREWGLVLIGPGYTEPKCEKGDAIIDLGFVPLQDKYDAYDASSLLCQPSVNESFSLVIMESWLTSTPVLVHGDGQVTKEHCLSSGGGLVFSDYNTFKRHIDFIISNPHIAKQMGKAGRDYVLKNYSWEQITYKYMDLFDRIKQDRKPNYTAQVSVGSTNLSRPELMHNFAYKNDNQKLTINIMTAGLTRGDAIGNYINSLKKGFEGMGYRVCVFADHGTQDAKFLLSSMYQSSEKDILWFHYSIYTDNFSLIKRSKGFKVMDFHGVTPPELFEGYHKELEYLTRKGQASLSNYVHDFDLCVVHSDYTYEVLTQAGYSRIVKSPLIVSDDLCHTEEDPIFSDLLCKLDYLLFVGRIVPQKDILSIIEIFSELKKLRPNIVLFLVGPMDIAQRYVQDVFDLIARLKLEKNILLTGKIVDPSVLVTFYKYAKFKIVMSKWETFCVPIIESMFFGVPVIGVNNTCVPETIGDAGILLEDLDSSENARLINELWEDNLKYSELRQNAIKRSKGFNQDELMKRISEIIERYIPNLVIS